MAAPYKSADVRREAIRQLHSRLVMEREEVADEMDTQPVTPHEKTTWGELRRDAPGAHKDGVRQVEELIEDAVDQTAWGVDLGASCLRHLTNSVWGSEYEDVIEGPVQRWDVAVQLAHRPGLGKDFHDELVEAVRSAVDGVLARRGITDTRLLPVDYPSEPAEPIGFCC